MLKDAIAAAGNKHNVTDQTNAMANSLNIIAQTFGYRKN